MTRYVPIAEESRKTLDEMVKACRDKGVQPVLFTLPFSGPYYYGEALKKYAEEAGCDYINMFDYVDEIGIDVNKDYFNRGHLNNDGAVKTSRFLGKYITEHYACTDMRTVEGNIWARNMGEE